MDSALAKRVNGCHKQPEEGAEQHANGALRHKNKRRSGSAAAASSTFAADMVPRLSVSEMQELTSAPDSLPVAPAPQRRLVDQYQMGHVGIHAELRGGRGYRNAVDGAPRPPRSPRTASTPPTTRAAAPTDASPLASSPRRFSFNQAASRPRPLNLSLNGFPARHVPSPAVQTGPAVLSSRQCSRHSTRPSSPIPPTSIPLPPMSLPTHLQLELAAQRPSPLYIFHPQPTDVPYESSSVKLARLKNILFLPPYLERTLYFGALACLDAWLYTFTILPVRFSFALGLLVRWWCRVIGHEINWLLSFVWRGTARSWRRIKRGPSPRFNDHDHQQQGPEAKPKSHRSSRASSRDAKARQAKKPSSNEAASPFASDLTPFHKADLLQGAVIICSSLALMSLDASRMYHFIRAQSAIKLYVIFNILEVGDRLLSALGQDILECLFSAETLSRDSDGRSRVALPLAMFVLSLIYSCLHSISLYYQVITLNVAVNSYSNALLTLLLSNQFVEIKSTVFKRFDKDNLFQLTCADIVERFQLWVMLLIIGMRNVVEVGGLSVPGAGVGVDSTLDAAVSGPLHSPSILPHSFTVLPSWLMSGEVLSPFLIVVGSEMVVDTIKHAYVTKFNNIKPTFYSRTLDILCKDYYINAFVTPSLTRRLGLAVIPLSCLFIRASVQTYHMFLSTQVSMPVPPSTQTSLTNESASPSSPAMTAALSRFDALIRDSLGRATYGYSRARPWYAWTSDDVIAALTMVIVFFSAFLILLTLKLLLGMALLHYSRRRFAAMKRAECLVQTGKLEIPSYDVPSVRTGGRPEVEVGEERRRWINADASEGLPGVKQQRPRESKPEGDFQGVFRYDMVAKRIW
ncbi:hypothetical protein CDD81_7281 [Ophiocordyceps australis]|uniref:Endoplasmic reticulum membrane protein 65 n=1 Tax=Ophiocordyceps australis TaxID=1399860 RepID=A0A2C5Y3R6_9HYPO|nr:hypothetical protein CDD81_7281 [Ophiocordyceps australis]